MTSSRELEKVNLSPVIQKQTGWSDPVDIHKWMSEECRSREEFVYSPAITSENTAVEPNEAYRKAAVHAAVDRAVLAGHRLASLLNSNLK